MKFHSCHYKFYSACKSAKNFTPNSFQFISVLSWNRSSVFLYCTMYFYMLILSLHSKHMHLVYWNDFVNRYIVCIWYLLDLHRLQFWRLSVFSFLYKFLLFSIRNRTSNYSSRISCFGSFLFTQPLDSLYVFFL